MTGIPREFPDEGLGEEHVFSFLREMIETESTDLGEVAAFAHMDPPTPGIAADLVGLNARWNQNLLHPSLSPFATRVERQLIDWLSPGFGMACGHMCAGSTIANLTALWAAREAGAKKVVTSEEAHISVAKSSHLLAMPCETVPVDAHGRLDMNALPSLASAALVLTAGTTGRGAIDRLGATDALWTHVDAAWAGPLRFSRYASRLDGIELADSVAVSAHKWFFQPKDSALVLFADEATNDTISIGGAYLATPNVGVQGSRSANAIPLLATLLAWGRSGLASRLERCMQNAETLAARLDEASNTTLLQPPETGVVNWRPRTKSAEAVLATLGNTTSSTRIGDEVWLRQVAANPLADIEQVWERIVQATG